MLAVSGPLRIQVFPRAHPSPLFFFFSAWSKSYEFSPFEVKNSPALRWLVVSETEVEGEWRSVCLKTYFWINLLAFSKDIRESWRQRNNEIGVFSKLVSLSHHTQISDIHCDTLSSALINFNFCCSRVILQEQPEWSLDHIHIRVYLSSN